MGALLDPSFYLEMNVKNLRILCDGPTKYLIQESRKDVERVFLGSVLRKGDG
jgi:hypothetical protein